MRASVLLVLLISLIVYCSASTHDTKTISSSLRQPNDPFLRSSGVVTHTSVADSSTFTIVYIVRHAEFEIITKSTGEATSSYDVDWVGDEAVISSSIIEEEKQKNIGKNLDEVCDSHYCAKELSDMGKVRATLLANWFNEKGIVSNLTAVYASHKHRTLQTVQPTAMKANLEVTQLPTNSSELDPGTVSVSICPTIDAIKKNHPLGSTILVGAHSDTIYKILEGGKKGQCNGLGIDTNTDPSLFPKDSRGLIPRHTHGYVWKVGIDTNGIATLLDVDVLEFGLTGSSVMKEKKSDETKTKVKYDGFFWDEGE